jgi:hypothetical protein
MTVYIQDGRRPAHHSWVADALQRGVADGAIFSAFHTPRVASLRNPAASMLVATVVANGGEAIFDATTHAALLPGSNDRVHYGTWSLWGFAGEGLDTPARRIEHVERVFQRQADLGTPFLCPTRTLDQPSGALADEALETAAAGRSLQSGCWQTVSGRRSFWRAGASLDAYVGQLAMLRAPVYMVTVVNDLVVDNQPDMTDDEAFAGVCRTVHSLSMRARVIVCHADYAGLPAVAAGADTVGAGWDRGMRFFDPLNFQLSSPGIRIPASYVTHGNLAAVIRRDAGDVISGLGAPIPEILRNGSMPPNDTAERRHHLACLREVVDEVDGHGSRRERVAALRHFYRGAAAAYDYLGITLPRVIPSAVRQRWVDQPLAALELYAGREGV